VIEDKNAQATAPDDTVTIADPGKAEPGRDVFADAPVKDIKSDTLPVQPPEPVREQKEVSSVIVGTLTSSSASPTSSDSKSSSTTNDLSKGTKAPAASEVAESEAAQVKAGPLGEADFEAQKVANELYPDAADK
jgi:dolichyl-phosphate-mannose-protein mannosyltransferase